MRIRILRGLKYLRASPKYFAAYFLGKPSSIINALNGKSAYRYSFLRNELQSDKTFFDELERKTSIFAQEQFQFTADHYFLYALIRVIQPKVIVETGVFDGYLTSIFLNGLEKNFKINGVDGRLISIDLPAYSSMKESTSEGLRPHLPSGCEPGWVIPEYLKSRWTLHLGDSRVLLPKIVKEVKNIDLFFHDSLHTESHMQFEFETAWPFIGEGRFLLSHDIHWNRAFGKFVKRHRQKEFAAHGFGIIQKKTRP